VRTDCRHSSPGFCIVPQMSLFTGGGSARRLDGLFDAVKTLATHDDLAVGGRCSMSQKKIHQEAQRHGDKDSTQWPQRMRSGRRGSAFVPKIPREAQRIISQGDGERLSNSLSHRLPVKITCCASRAFVPPRPLRILCGHCVESSFSVSPCLCASAVNLFCVHGRIFPCSALFFDMGIWPRVKESPAACRFAAFMRAPGKRIALLFALFAGRRRSAVFTPRSTRAISTAPRDGCRRRGR
jgi:hypothetical protein